MPFFCKPSRGPRAKQHCGATAAGARVRLLVIDKQVSPHGHLAAAVLPCVHVVNYDSSTATNADLLGLIRDAHAQNNGPFSSIAVANHGADPATKRWAWAANLSVDLAKMHRAVGQLAPVVEALTAALSNTRMGEAHIDFLARGLATTCRGLVPALEKLYGVDFRASVDATGNALNGGDWKMETDNDYDVAADCLDAAKLKACTQTMGKCSVCGKTTPCACSTTQVTLKHSAYRQLYGGEG